MSSLTVLMFIDFNYTNMHQSAKMVTIVIIENIKAIF